jgi:AGZA family xanthine/uracil permease-like MFS transporter
MMRSVTGIDFSEPTEGIPAFLTIIIMPLAYSIAEGIVFGLLSFVLLKVCAAKFREVTAVTWVLFVVFVFRFLVN